MRRWIATVLVGASLPASGCGGGGGGGGSDGGSPDAGCALSYDPPTFLGLQHEERFIGPMALDPATDILPTREHAVLIATDRPLRDELFVWLPGTDHLTDNNLGILRIAAAAGYRTLGLAYVNEEPVSDTCSGQPPACRGEVRTEKLYGTDETPLIEISPANSIEHRLVTLLGAAHAQFPSEGWDAYLEAGQPKWESIVFGGFSQGASMAGMISRDHLVARAIFVGTGGGDVIVDSQAMTVELAPWSVEPRATPAERAWSLLHLRDGFPSKELVARAYGMDAFGEFARADLESPPYDCTHLLSTDHTPRQSDSSFHNSLASDKDVPVDANGIPLLAEDYYYLMVQ